MNQSNESNRPENKPSKRDPAAPPSEEKMKFYMDSAEKEIKDYLYNNYVQPNLRPTPFKSMEVAEAQAKEQIEKMVKTYKEEISKATQLFIAKMRSEEEDAVFDVLRGLMDYMPMGANAGKRVSMDPKKAQVLEVIAKRELDTENYADASTMYRFIIQVAPNYTPAWVGWAAAEEAQGNKEVVEGILVMSLRTMPDDPFVAISAARFFMATERNERAIEVLEKAKDNLVRANKQHSEGSKQLDDLLRDLQGK